MTIDVRKIPLKGTKEAKILGTAIKEAMQRRKINFNSMIESVNLDCSSSSFSRLLAGDQQWTLETLVQTLTFLDLDIEKVLHVSLDAPVTPETLLELLDSVKELDDPKALRQLFVIAVIPYLNDGQAQRVKAIAQALNSNGPI